MLFTMSLQILNCTFTLQLHSLKLCTRHVWNKRLSWRATATFERGFFHAQVSNPYFYILLAFHNSNQALQAVFSGQLLQFLGGHSALDFMPYKTT